MTTAEEARRRTLNAIKETYKDQLELIDAIIDRACDKLQYEDTVTFESDEDRSNVKLYLYELGYRTWYGVGGECKLTISWRHEKKSNKK